MAQADGAAERSAHVTRGEAPRPYEPRCCVCGGPWQKGGASYAVRVGPPLMEVCSAACMGRPPFAKET